MMIVLAIVGPLVGIAGFLFGVFKIIRRETNRLGDKLDATAKSFDKKLDRLRDNEIAHLQSKVNECCTRIAVVETRLNERK